VVRLAEASSQACRYSRQYLVTRLVRHHYIHGRLPTSNLLVYSCTFSNMTARQSMGLVPLGQHEPFARVAEDDHRYRIIISSAMGVSFVLLAIVLRIIIRRFVIVGWGLEDSVMVISSVSLRIWKLDLRSLLNPISGVSLHTVLVSHGRQRKRSWCLYRDGFLRAAAASSVGKCQFR
jgi:hypothetical protein